MHARRKRWPVPALIAGGVAVGLSFGNATTAQAAEAGAPPPVRVDFVGDSLSSGEGLHGTYFDANDMRHQSRMAAPAQALARLASANPGVAVDAKVAASSGALMVDFFAPQTVHGTVVNSPQLDQVRADADAVVVSFGGSDVMITELMHAAASAEGAASFDALMAMVEPGLSTLASDEVYREQAAKSEPGGASTVTARLLRVLEATRTKAPTAKIVVTNYPILVDPGRSSAFEEFSAEELTRLREFGQRLNAAIERAVRICDCATLADVSGALEGREVYAEDAAVNDLSAGLGGPAVDHRAQEVFQPNLKGATLIAEPIAGALARTLELGAPKGRPAEPTGTEGITLAPAVAEVPARAGVAPRDERVGGEVADHRKPRPAPSRPEPTGPAPDRVPAVVREVVVVTRPVPHLVPVIVGAAPPGNPVEESGVSEVDAQGEAAGDVGQVAAGSSEVEEGAAGRAETGTSGSVDEAAEHAVPVRAWGVEPEGAEAAERVGAEGVKREGAWGVKRVGAEAAERVGAEGVDRAGAWGVEPEVPVAAEPEAAEDAEREAADGDDLARRPSRDLPADWRHRLDLPSSHHAERQDAVEDQDTDIEQATLLPCAVTEDAPDDLVPCPPEAAADDTTPPVNG